MSNESLALLVVLTLILVLPWLAALSLRVWTLRSSPPPSSSHPNLPQPVLLEGDQPLTLSREDPLAFLKDREVLAVRREMLLHPQPLDVSIETPSAPSPARLGGPTPYWTTSLSLPADVVMEAQAGNLVAVLTLGTLTAHSLAFYRSGGRSGGPRTMPNVEETPWPGPTLSKTSASPGASTSTTEAGPAAGPTPSPEEEHYRTCPDCLFRSPGAHLHVEWCASLRRVRDAAP